MKYIVITSKHHDGFAMYHSKADDFNIVASTSFGRDPMRELATACKKVGIGFGFYYSHNQDWTCPEAAAGRRLDLLRATTAGAGAIHSIVKVELDGTPQADPTWGLDPGICTEIQAEFAELSAATKEQVRWMEKFGECKHVTRVHQWEDQGRATWEIDVLVPGGYQVDLSYAGEGRLVWGVGIKGGEHIQNQQNSSHNYQTFPIGLLEFPEPGRYAVSVSCLEGKVESGSLQSIHFTRRQS